MVYAMTFDDFKRKLAAKPEFGYVVVADETCSKDTPVWKDWLLKFNAPTNPADATGIHMTIEPDGWTYTFYHLVPKSEYIAPVAPVENRTKSDNAHGH